MKLLRQILLAGILCLTFTAHAELDMWDKVDRFGFIYYPCNHVGISESMCKGVTSDGPQSGDLVIPSSAPYGTVVAIEANSFSNNPDYTSVTLPYNICQIRDYAFSNCTGLTSIILDNAGHYAFFFLDWRRGIQWLYKPDRIGFDRI